MIFLSFHYGHHLRILHWQFDQTVSGALAEMDLTAAQGQIMGFLSHRKTPPCSRDIEESFHLSHPTVSGLLSRLEKKLLKEMQEAAKALEFERAAVLRDQLMEVKKWQKKK